MATIATQIASVHTGDPTFSAASGGGDLCATGDNLLLLVHNGAGSSVTLTVTTPGTVSGLAVADDAIVIGAGAIKPIPLSKALFANDNGQAALGWSSATSVTVAVISS